MFLEGSGFPYLQPGWITITGYSVFQALGKSRSLVSSDGLHGRDLELDSTPCPGTTGKGPQAVRA